jgi:hypothetical protein
MERSRTSPVAVAHSQVTLLVTSPDEVVSVSVVDGLPAGLEALDSAIYTNQPSTGAGGQGGDWWWWWFNPFQVRGVVFFFFVRVGSYDRSALFIVAVAGSVLRRRIISWIWHYTSDMIG